MQQSFISDRSLYNGQKNTVIHLVEKMADIQIDDPGCVEPEFSKTAFQSLMTASTFAKGKA